MKKAELIEILHIQQRYGKDTLVLRCSVFYEARKGEVILC